MDRLHRYVLPSLPWVAAVVAATLVVGVLWVLPATKAGTVTTETTGAPRTVTWDGSRSRSTQLEWSREVIITDPVDEVQLHPHLYLRIAVPFTPSAGHAEMDIDVRVFLNGVEAGREMGGHVMFEGPGGGGFTETRGGIPDDVEDVRQDALHEGTNTIRVQADIRLNVISSGSQSYTITLGPLTTDIYQADGDGDGVVDVHQVAPAVHTGFIAVPAAGIMGWGAFALVRRLLKRRGPPEP